MCANDTIEIQIAEMKWIIVNCNNINILSNLFYYLHDKSDKKKSDNEIFVLNEF